MSYEDEIKNDVANNKKLPEKLNIPVLKYFWQVNPLTSGKTGSIPRFLRKIEVFKNFSDSELQILSKFLHTRTFTSKEIIFRQNEIGIGFYIVYSGMVEIFVDDNLNSTSTSNSPLMLVALEKGDYFGELALLQQKSVRNATARARENCELIGIFKPDIEELIQRHPIVAAKLLQSVSTIVANRLFLITQEVRDLKFKLSQFGVGDDDRK